MAANYSSDEEEDNSQNLVTCENCMEYEGYILDPRTLQCQHVFCVPCLDGQRRNPKKLFCAHKDCLREHDVTIDALPSALGDLKMCCDTCAKKKGERFMTASVYCVPCGMKYCNDHHKVHDQVNTHQMMSIKEYLQSSFAHELRYCDKHKQEVCSMGCPDCSQIFCVECVNTIGDCQDGSPHGLKLVSLKKLSDDIKGSVEPLKIKAEDKFDDISAVIKETTITLSEWDIVTDEGVRFIRRIRDEQLDVIREKYTKVEEDYIRSRKSSKKEITDYLAEKAAVIQSEYLTQLKKLRTDITYRNPVDLIRERAEIEKKISDLMSQDFPKLVLQKQVTPVKKEEHREMEIELLSTDDVIISDHITPPVIIQPPITPPTGLQFVREVKVDSPCYAVCQYKGYTYVGLENGGISRIDDQGNVTSQFIKTADCVLSIRAYNDRLYILVYGKPFKLYVYDLAGQLITHWDTNDYGTNQFHISPYAGSKICIMRDQLCFVNSNDKRVTVYTLNGDIVRHIPCPLLSEHRAVSMCEAGEDSLIITHDKSSKVFRLNLTLGEVEWVSTQVLHPQGVICYRGKYVLVTSGGEWTKLWIFNVRKKNCRKLLVGDLTGKRKNNFAYIYDLYIEGDTLIVPDSEGKAVSYYRLQF